MGGKEVYQMDEREREHQNDTNQQGKRWRRREGASAESATGVSRALS